MENAINACKEQIDIAFEAQHDDLARTFIRKQLEAEHRLRAATRAIAAVAAEADALQNQLREQQAQLDAIIAQIPLDTGEQSYACSPVSSAAPTGVTAEDVEAAFLREKRNRAEEGD
ncbi:MAG: hypothetical protein ETSY1_27225 [Candidatus Entotheonella factor]|uniref:Uncharacterized protein n=1 Tax=Entotheonella factor TaxID=1429438 RepID=W4LG43_ENTF1|nr:MAG: hypothetical protein ETSY1_27225 [Candidatus Entotheonella factor]